LDTGSNGNKQRTGGDESVMMGSGKGKTRETVKYVDTDSTDKAT
jgi:hypothetical protein